MKSDTLLYTICNGSALKRRHSLAAFRMATIVAVVSLFLLPGTIGAVGKRY